MKKKKSSGNKLGEQVDKIYAKDREIHQLEAELRELKAERMEMETVLLRGFEKDEIEGCKGINGTAYIKRARFPQVKNRRQLQKWIIANKAWELFQNRVASKAYFDRIENGQDIPGVEIFERVHVTVIARKGK